MKRILFFLSFIILSWSAFGQETMLGIYNDQRGNIFIRAKNISAWQIDGYSRVILNGDTLVRVRANGILAAEELNILPDGSNMASQINAVAGMPFVKAPYGRSLISENMINGKGAKEYNGGLYAHPLVSNAASVGVPDSVGVNVGTRNDVQTLIMPDPAFSKGRILFISNAGNTGSYSLVGSDIIGAGESNTYYSDGSAWRLFTPNKGYIIGCHSLIISF